MNVINRFCGVCQILCELVLVYDDCKKVIEKYNCGNISDEDEQNIEFLATRKCVLDLIGIIQKILLIFFKKFPGTVLAFIEQKQLIESITDENNKKVKSINKEILENTLNKMQNGQYLQLFFMHIEKKNLFKKFDAFHTTLIFKTIEEGRVRYNFFNPNGGLFKSDNINDIKKIIDKKVLQNRSFENFTDLGLIDIKQLLPRNRLHLENTNKINEQLALQPQS